MAVTSACTVLTQLPAVTQTRGVTIVVSPLVSLIQDQVESLVDKGIGAVAISSLQTKTEAVQYTRGMCVLCVCVSVCPLVYFCACVCVCVPAGIGVCVSVCPLVYFCACVCVVSVRVCARRYWCVRVCMSPRILFVRECACCVHICAL